MYKSIIDKWISSKKIDESYKIEINNLSEKELEDRFYKELEFGTGGLRGVIGSGTNRINIYTVGKVTQGYANFLKDNYKNQEISVAVAYDSRIKSDEFAKRVALIFASNNIKVYLYESLRPTPMLSFAVRELGCKGGVVITASHNPKEYNGYKVYGEDGGQLTDELAKKVYDYINDVNMFEGIDLLDEQEAINSLKVEYIGKEIDNIYINNVKNLVIRKELVKDYASNLKIVYTPLHGSGYMPITRVLNELGYSDLKVVEEQKDPDGNFSTVPYPNPELQSVYELAIELAKKNDSDIIFATDPDCDRVGVAVKNSHNEYELLNGNQLGILLSEYILKSLNEIGKLDKNGVIVKTIVSSDVVKEIGKEFNVEVLEVLTGFKYIGEKIKEFEKSNHKFVFGFEESYGYLMGSFVRDKDGVIAVNIIAEMALYYKKLGKTLSDALEDIYTKYVRSKEELINIELKGKDGQEKISKCIEDLRNMDLIKIGNFEVSKIQDYKLGIEKNLLDGVTSKLDLPISNVLKVVFKNNSWFVVRPSGTEPKMKIYFYATSDNEDLNLVVEEMKKSVLDLINKSIN